jgi:hypothetical protein
MTWSPHLSVRSGGNARRVSSDQSVSLDRNNPGPPQSSQMRSPQQHSNMWMISPVCLFITVRTSSSRSPQKRQRLVEELSISATFSA